MRKRESTLWKWYSEYIKIRDCLETTGTINEGVCITCQKRVPRFGSHAGHFIHDKKSTYYIESNTHLQCSHCNHYLSGNLGLYGVAMVEKYGKEAVQELIRKSNQEVKQLKKFEIKEMATKYRLLVKDLLKKHA